MVYKLLCLWELIDSNVQCHQYCNCIMLLDAGSQQTQGTLFGVDSCIFVATELCG